MIPKSFQILGHTIKVKITDNVPENSVGEWKGNQNVIHIRPVGDDMPESLQEQTFWHEVVHCIFSTLNYDKHDKDEQLVDLIAGCLHQIDKTKK